VPHLTSRQSALRRPLAAKVPEINLLFWAIKLLTFVGIVFLVIALRLQLRAREYRAPTYWSAVLAVAIFGTMAADGVRDGAGVSYAATTAVCALGVAAFFALWYRSEGTLSIHSITTARRERIYWMAVFATFRARDGSRRLDRDAARPGVLRVRTGIRRAHRDPRARMVACAAEPHRRVLGRVHHHPPTGSLVRGLVLQAQREHRPRPR
jgi:hypothetical protein